MTRTAPFILLLLAVSFCAEVRDANGPSVFTSIDDPAGVSVYYDRDVQALFERSCTGGCHEPGGIGVAESDLDLTAGDSYSELLDPTRSKNGPHIAPGDPDNSLLVWKIEGKDAAGRDVYGDPMPQGRPTLSTGEIQAVRTWIREGALFSSAPPAPPRVISVTALDERTIELRFDEALDTASASEATHYSILQEEDPILSVAAVELIGAQAVRLTASGPIPASEILIVAVSGVKGDNGLALNTVDRTEFTYTPVVRFSEQIQPLFDTSCAFVGCHAADDRFPPGADLVLTAGNAYGQLVGAGSTQVAKSRVEPGDGAASYLIDKLAGTATEGDRMPLGGPYLSATEVAMIRLWIDQGAADD